MILREFWPPEAEYPGIQHERAHALLREALAGLGIRDGTLAAAEKGKPFLVQRPELAFNLSHCHGGCAVFVAGHGRAGVDMENIRPHNPAVVRRFFSPEEQAFMAASADPDRDFFRLWTLKESFVKASGEGLAYPISRVSFSLGPRGKILSGPENAIFEQYEDVRGFIAATCLLP